MKVNMNLKITVAQNKHVRILQSKSSNLLTIVKSRYLSLSISAKPLIVNIIICCYITCSTKHRLQVVRKLFELSHTSKPCSNPFGAPEGSLHPSDHCKRGITPRTKCF